MPTRCGAPLALFPSPLGIVSSPAQRQLANLARQGSTAWWTLGTWAQTVSCAQLAISAPKARHLQLLTLARQGDTTLQLALSLCMRACRALPAPSAGLGRQPFPPVLLASFALRTQRQIPWCLVLPASLARQRTWPRKAGALFAQRVRTAKGMARARQRHARLGLITQYRGPPREEHVCAVTLARCARQLGWTPPTVPATRATIAPLDRFPHLPWSAPQADTILAQMLPEQRTAPCVHRVPRVPPGRRQ